MSVTKRESRVLIMAALSPLSMMNRNPTALMRGLLGAAIGLAGLILSKA